MMNLGRRAAFLVALAVLVAAALGATLDGSAAPSASAEAGKRPVRLVAFRSCSDLLGYAKAQATKFVGPYGLGAPVAVGAPVGTMAPGKGAAPQEGVDYSGTNVQEEGVD